MSVLRALGRAVRAFGAPDYETTRLELRAGKRRYRVKRVLGGWEPQMLHTCGVPCRAVWFPLDADGYWAEPDAFSYGAVSGRHPLPKPLAERAITCAKRINADRLIEPVNNP